MTPAEFRVAFPAFADPLKYPDPTIVFWLGWSGRLLNADRWGELLPLGQQLFTAHNLVLEGSANVAGASGGAGAIVGPISSAHVDKVGYSRDAGSAMLPGAGHWNLSTYGLRLKYLMGLIGTGPVQVGVPGPETPMGSMAWPGPSNNWYGF